MLTDAERFEVAKVFDPVRKVRFVVAPRIPSALNCISVFDPVGVGAAVTLVKPDPSP